METTVGTLDDKRQTASQAFAGGQLVYSMGLYSEIFKDKEYIPIIDDVINYGALPENLNNSEEARAHYKKYLDLFSNHVNLIQNACNCWIESKDFEHIDLVLNQALEKDFKNTALLLSLGFTEISAGNREKACKIFERIGYRFEQL